VSIHADLRAPFSLQYWLGLPRERVRFARRFIGIAVTLAAAKVFLNTVAFALFLANEGPGQLPRFYLVLALAAIVLSIGLGIVVDRMPKLHLARITLVMIMLASAAGKLMLAAGLPGAYFAILATAFIFEIAIEILFWAACAAYVDTTELKRTTPLICLAIALGGAFGGLLARALSWTVDAPDLLVIMVVFAGIALFQFAVPADFDELQDSQSPAAAGDEAPRGEWRLLRLATRHPLLVLLALNALALTILYGIAEFLILSVYREHYPQEQELTRFLGMVFALLQACEFVLLASLSRTLLERATPLVRNLVFPLSSLICFLGLAFSNRLAVAVIAHVNAEAASNAIFQPVHNANFLALPLRIQGRARTLAEGVFYPTGLAIAGALLWWLEAAGAIAAAEFIAVMFTLVFILINVGVGVLFLPTLIANVGSGLVGPARTAAAAMPPPGMRALLGMRQPERRSVGGMPARHLGPERLEDDLLALAAHPDRATRTALARLIDSAPAPWVAGFLDRCLSGEAEERLKLALLVMLIRRTQPTPECTQRVLDAHDPAVVALGHTVTQGVGAWPRIQPLVRSSRVSSDLVDAIVAAGRTDLAPLLLACLPTAEPEQQRRALVLLNAAVVPSGSSVSEVALSLARRRDPAVRGEAIVLLSRTSSSAAAVRQLIASLDDPDARVRRRAAAALCDHGDRATARLRHRLAGLTPASLDAAWVLARIGTSRARRVLAAYLRALQQDAESSAQLLGWIAASPDPARWSALELCLRDHQAGMLDVILAALPPAIDPRLARRLRVTLRGSDQRSRASAFELIAAVPASQRPPGAVDLLRYLLLGNGADARGPALGANGPEMVHTQARASMSPWVRRAAALSLACASLPLPAVPPAGAAEVVDRDGAGDCDMAMDFEEFERIIALKRMPLFRYVPFDIVAEVARTAQVRAYAAGEEVVAADTRRQDLLVLEAGALTLAHRDGDQTLAAPGCFGEVALCGERMPWPRITALENSRVSFLRAAIFEELCREHPEIAIELCRLLARRLRATVETQAETPVSA
jgi:HEAT repeat protein